MQTITNLFGETEILKSDQPDVITELKQGFKSIIRQHGLLYFQTVIIDAVRGLKSPPPKGITVDEWLTAANQVTREQGLLEADKSAKRCKKSLEAARKRIG